MQRLTNALRDVMVKNAIEKAGINAENDALLKKEIALANKILTRELAPYTQEMLREQEQELQARYGNIKPDTRYGRWFQQSQSLTVVDTSLGTVHYLHLGEESLITPSSRINEKQYKQQLQHLANKKEKVRRKQKELCQKTYAILNSYTSMKKLLNDWPEAKALLPDEEAQKQTTALAIPRADINALIGLKQEVSS